MGKSWKKYFLMVFHTLNSLIVPRSCIAQNENSTVTFLNICSVLERGNPRLVVDYNRIGAAMDLSLKVVNEEFLPPEVQLRKLYKDGGRNCSPKNLAISHIIEWARDSIRCDIFVGPGCTHAVLDMYQAAERLGIPIIAAPGAYVSGLSGVPRSGFSNMIRTAYTFVDLGKCLLKFMDLFNYSHNSVIVDLNDPFFSEMGDSFRIQHKAQNPNIRKNTTFLDLSVDVPSRKEYQRQLDLLLNQVNRVSRVIMIFANSSVVRDLLIMASRKGMTQGEHVYLSVEMYRSKIWGTYTWVNNDPGDALARIAYQSLIIVSMAEVNGPQMDEFARLLRKLAQQKYNYTFGTFERIDPVVMAYYDAVILYGSAVRTIIDNGAVENITDLNTLMRSMRNITILSGLQANIDIGANGDRIVLYEIKHFSQDLSTGTSTSASPFLRLDFVNNEFTWLGTLKWPHPDGSFTTELPFDIPRCGFLNDECKPDENNNSGLVASAVVIPLILIISGIVAGYIYHRRLNQVRDPYWWRYFLSDLEFTTSLVSGRRSPSAKSMQSKVSSVKQTETVCLLSAWTTAFLHGSIVSINSLPDKCYQPTTPLLQDLEPLRQLRHQNLQRFVGLCLEESTHHGWILYIIGECCAKGCLQDIINRKKIKLDWSFRFSFIKDIIEGLWYLHSTPIQSHGYLTSKTILVDGRFVAKLAEFGIAKLKNHHERERNAWQDEKCDEELLQNLLWRAPELLRIKMPENGTQKGMFIRKGCSYHLCCAVCRRMSKTNWANSTGDIYSFAIVLQQIILRTYPYMINDQDFEEYGTNRAHEILSEVAKGQPPLLRPPASRSACSTELYDLLESCWSELPLDRPTAARVRDVIKKISGIKNDNIIDLIINRMEQYSLELETQLSEKAELLQMEKFRQEAILKQILPSGISQSLLQGLAIKPKVFSFGTVCISKISGLDIVLETGSSQLEDATNALAELLFCFDATTSRNRLFCIPSSADTLKFIDDRCDPTSEWMHVKTCVTVGLEFLDSIQKICATYKCLKNQVSMKCGIHSGSCLFLTVIVTGQQVPNCFLVGSTVTVAEHLQSTCEINRIHISGTSKKLLSDLLDGTSDYSIIERTNTLPSGNGTSIPEHSRTYWIQKDLQYSPAAYSKF